MSVILHPLGIALAIIFATSLLLLLAWMFKVPPQLPQEVAAICYSVAALERILVPVSGRGSSERAVELACRLGEAQKADIILTYVIEVPLTLPLNSPMPNLEAQGQEALHTARLIVERHGLEASTRLIPHRRASGGIIELAKSEVVDAIVMGSGQQRPGQMGESVGRTSQEVLRNAPCEVIVDRVPC